MNRMMVVAAAAVMACGCAKGSAIASAVKASSFGFDAADSTAFLQKALDSGVRKLVIDKQVSDWIVRPLFVTNSNIEIVLEDGVAVRAKKGEFRGRSDSLFKLCGGVSNVTIRGEGMATIAMRKRDYLDPAMKYDFSGGHRMTLAVWDAKNVTVKNLTILSSGGDGVYLNGPENVVLEDLRCRDHKRQGMSPINVKGLKVRRCEFNETAGTAPQCGIDMEPNYERHCFTDVVYEDCVFNGNAAHGIDLYFGPLTARSKPVDITFRRCVSCGNRACGLSFMSGSPLEVMKRGHVKGRVSFESCVFERNGSMAVKIANNTADGVDIRFADCTFDARGSSAEAAIALSNAQLQRDFGGVTFERCRVFVDGGREACAFEASPGVGIVGTFKGVLAVDCAGKKSEFDLAKLAERFVPHPELIVDFRSAAVDFRTVAAPAAAPLKGVMTPGIRNPFVFVQAVPGAGEYPVRFSSYKLRTRKSKVCGIVQLLDRAGTDLGTFEIPEGDFTYTIKCRGPNVYRFEVSPRNTGIVSVGSATPGGALLLDRQVHLFGGSDVGFHFRVPAAAKEILADIRPEEPASARLFDAAGRLVDEKPFNRSCKVLKAVRTPTAVDEIWCLRLPKVQEDFNFQLGGEAVPLVSTEKDGVIAIDGKTSRD